MVVSIRPERLHLSPIDAPVTEPNALHGVLAHVRYLGLSTQYVVETPEGHNLTVTNLNVDAGVELLEPGTSVRVLCGLDAPRLLKHV